MEERFRLQRAEQLQEERRQRPGDRLAERSRMPWFILVTCKSVKHYRGPSIWGGFAAATFSFPELKHKICKLKRWFMWKPCDLRCRLVMLQQQLQAAPSGLDKLRRNLAEAMEKFCDVLCVSCFCVQLGRPLQSNHFIIFGAWGSYLHHTSRKLICTFLILFAPLR